MYKGGNIDKFEWKIETKSYNVDNLTKCLTTIIIAPFQPKKDS